MCQLFDSRERVSEIWNMLYVILQVENVYPVITKVDKEKHELVTWKARKSSALVIQNRRRHVHFKA